jgi:hypothetical protein
MLQTKKIIIELGHGRPLVKVGIHPMPSIWITFMLLETAK